MKSKRWWLRTPGESHAMTFHFEQPIGKREARRRMVEWAGGPLTRGSEIWAG